MRTAQRKLRSTLRYNPCLPRHCGYQCILRASGRKATLSQVKRLRAHVSQRLQQAYLMNETVSGVHICSIVQQSDMTLQSYIHDIAMQQWVSQAELAIAAELQKLSVWIANGKSWLKLGEGTPSFVIVLVDKHYVQKKLHRGTKKKDAEVEHENDMREKEVMRAGMWVVPREWDTEEEEQRTVINVTTVQEMRRTYRDPTFISVEGLPTDLVSATIQMRYPIQVAVLRRRLGQLMGIHHSLLRILSPDYPGVSLQDWTHAPTVHAHCEGPDLPGPAFH